MSRLKATYDRAVAAAEATSDGWLMGLLARFAFAAVLFGYFLNSARTKVGEGVGGFFTVTDNAYYQIVLPAVEAAGNDVSQVAFVPWGLIVHAGTYAEFALPVLVVIGLFTRLAALGMIAFIVVQSYVDVAVHNVGSAAGTWFDRFPDGVIADQRLMWIVPLAYLVLRGGGALSLDRALGRMVGRPLAVPAP